MGTYVDQRCALGGYVCIPHCVGVYVYPTVWVCMYTLHCVDPQTLSEGGYSSRHPKLKPYIPNPNLQIQRAVQSEYERPNPWIFMF